MYLETNLSFIKRLENISDLGTKKVLFIEVILLYLEQYSYDLFVHTEF